MTKHRSTFVAAPLIRCIRKNTNWGLVGNIAAVLGTTAALVMLGIGMIDALPEPHKTPTAHCETITVEDGYSFCDG